MRIVIVNYSDSKGGASRAAYRLHCALLASGVDSYMVVSHKGSDDPRVIETRGFLKQLKFKFRYRREQAYVKRQAGRPLEGFSPGLYSDPGIIEAIEQLRPDIIHLHWVQGVTLSIEDMARISTPVCWSLHDQWAFTSGQHYLDPDISPTAKQSVISNTPDEPTARLYRDVLERKQHVYSRLKNWNIIGLSKWMAEGARESKLCSKMNVFHLPNPIDTERFKPLDKVKARIELGLPADSKLILFGAFNVDGDPRKGFRELKSALGQLAVRDAELIVFGMNEPKGDSVLSLKANYLGEIHDDQRLAMLYAAADVTVVPSLQENLSNTLMESLACGTPCVAFNTSGNPDLVVHKENGFLAQAYEPEDLAKGIEWVLSQQSADKLRHAARQHVLEHFEQSRVAGNYIALYKKILQSLG